MSNNATDELLNYINAILADYATTCGVEPFNGQIIIAEDMRKSYLALRGNKADKNAQNLHDIQRYHGLTVQPSNESDTFTILLNKDYIVESINKGNIDWVGTLVHEATHVNDFKDYYKIVSPRSWDELYEYGLHRTFLLWTEFHARAIGHYFLRKYTLNDFRSTDHIPHIMNTELPFQIKYMVQEMNSTDDPDRQLYVVVHFLGRLAVWQHLYPTTFDANFIKGLTNTNPWMEEIYYLFTKYDTIEGIHPHFGEFDAIMDKYFP